MLLRGKHKSEKPGIHASALEKAMDKEVEHRWEFTLTIDSIYHIKNAGVAPLGVA